MVGNIFVCVVFIVALLLESWKTTSRIACLLMEPKRSRCLRQDQKFISKITRKCYLHLLSFTLILKQSQKKIDSCQPSDGQSYTTTYQSHKACGYGYKLVCRYDNRYSKPEVNYRGEDCIEKFIREMLSEVQDCQRIVREQFQKPLVMAEKNERDFQNSTKCHICSRKFKVGEGKPSKQKVRDHCHITGKYRGAAHSDCNLKWAISAEKLKIPVVFHNLKGYDCHFIMQKIGHLIRQDFNIDVSVIASNFEKYIGFNIGKHLTFIDSFSFMSQSLDRLSSNLSDYAFYHTRGAFPNDEQFRLIKRKGVYPYDYMDSFQRFSENTLPRIEDFYSILNDTNISESDYSHAKEVWSAFQIRDLGEYHDLYLRTEMYCSWLMYLKISEILVWNIIV